MKNPLGGGILRQVWDPGTMLFSEMLRPRELGYDDRVGDFYDPAPGPGGSFIYPGMIAGPGGYLAINSGLSQTLGDGDVLVSTISNPETSSGACQFPPRWETIYETCGGTCSNGNRCGSSPTKQAAVLSIVLRAPNATPVDGQAFRRPYSLPTATDRSGLPHLTVADIDWAALPRAAWPTGTGYPAASHLAPLVARVWLDHHANLNAEDLLNPTDHMAGYGQYQREMLCSIAAVMCLNPDGAAGAPQSSTPPANADFRKLCYGLLQAGIDTWGLTQQPTHTFNANGGKGGGRKFALVMSGRMFGANAYAGLSAGLPSMVGGPWVVDRLVQGNIDDWELFVEDEQIFAAVPTDTSHAGWDWQGSPWKWGFDRSDRTRQALEPVFWTYGECEGETKRFLSTSAYVGIAIALRMFKLETAWANQAFFGYMDRWMVPAHAAIPTAYNACPHPGLHGLTDVSRQVVELNPAGAGILSLTVWDLYRWQPDVNPVTTPPVRMRPDGFRFDQPVPAGGGGACHGLRKPTLLTELVPAAGAPVMLEMFASEDYTFTPPAPLQWWALYLGGNYSSVPIPLAGPYNSDDLYVDVTGGYTATVVVLVDAEFGYSAQHFPIPAGAAGLDVAFQFAMLEDPIFSCVATSNALVLRIQ